MKENIERRLLMSGNDKILELRCNEEIFNLYNEIRITDINGDSYCILPSNELNKELVDNLGIIE